MTHPMSDGRPPHWATSWGEDRYGVWAGFDLQDAEGNYIEQRMRWIYSGAFLMGSPEGEAGRFDREGPQHAVRLTSGFWLADTACTQELWTVVMGDNPSRFKGALRPVEQVSVDMVEAFLTKLNAQCPHLSVRVPYEAEWEYACRAGSSGPLYWNPGSEEMASIDEIAWYPGNANDETHDVATKVPNEWGLYDMLGNVYEWCGDELREYESRTEPLVNPFEPARGDALRVVRGGSWHDLARYVRAAYRDAYDPRFARDNLGFRLARGQV